MALGVRRGWSCGRCLRSQTACAAAELRKVITSKGVPCGNKASRRSLVRLYVSDRVQNHEEGTAEEIAEAKKKSARLNPENLDLKGESFDCTLTMEQIDKVMGHRVRAVGSGAISTRTCIRHW